MNQLKMYLLPEIRVPELLLPEGFSVVNCKNDAHDIDEWFGCCLQGSLVNEEGTAYEAFKKDILDRNIVPEDDVFFLDFRGEHIATSTCYIMPDGNGDLHMVGMKTAWRGKGLAKYIVYAATRHLNGRNVKYIALTTDEFRRGAVKTYLNAGYLPVNYDTDMVERWENMLADIHVASSPMLKNDGSFDRIVYASQEKKEG